MILGPSSVLIVMELLELSLTPGDLKLDIFRRASLQADTGEESLILAVKN